MQMIIAPSKTQKFNGRYLKKYSIPAFLDKTEKLHKTLQQFSDSQLRSLMKTSENLTLATRRKLDDFTIPFSPENAKQALFTFQGDAYQAIDAEKYSPGQLDYGQQHLFILSGFYGALRPLDLMQPYRLEMGAPLQVDNARNLYEFWTRPVTELLETALGQDSDQTLVNLASLEYSKTLTTKDLPGKWVDIVFKQKSKGTLKTIAIYSKRARGMMVDFAVEGQLESAEELQEFDRDGYNFSEEGSTERQWLFLQE